MRRALTLLTLIAALPLGARANHEPEYPREVTFHAVPCALACAYWLDVANTDVGDDDSPEVYFDACDSPFPRPSYDEIRVEVPYWADWVVFEIFPEVDWDAFVCGAEKETVIGDPILGSSRCDNVVEQNSELPIGCTETISVRVRPLRTVILRAYNAFDPFPLRARYSFFDKA